MDRRGISVMQDAILFLVFISLSATIFMSAITYDIIGESMGERKMDEVADETLLALLSTTPDEFEYVLSKNAIEKAMGNMSRNRYGETVLEWIAGIKEYHKSYGELIAEDLFCQIRLRNKRINWLTKDFDIQLRNKIKETLDMLIGGKYSYNLTAKWRPVYGIPFGGCLAIGVPPPPQAYVSKTFISMPLTPVIEIKGREICLTKGWIREKVEEARNFYENESSLIYHFIFDGLRGENGTIFPGIINMTIHFILNNLMEMNLEYGNISILVSQLFPSLSINSIASYISHLIYEEFKDTINEFINYDVEEILERVNIGRAEICLSIWKK